MQFCPSPRTGNLFPAMVQKPDGEIKGHYGLPSTGPNTPKCALTKLLCFKAAPVCMAAPCLQPFPRAGERVRRGTVTLELSDRNTGAPALKLPMAIQDLAHRAHSSLPLPAGLRQCRALLQRCSAHPGTARKGRLIQRFSLVHSWSCLVRVPDRLTGNQFALTTIVRKDFYFCESVTKPFPGLCSLFYGEKPLFKTRI